MIRRPVAIHPLVVAALAVSSLLVAASPARASGFSVRGILDATAPASTPAYTAAAQLVTGRLGRNGGAGPTCGAPLAYPGATATSSYRFDTYTFTAATSGCMTFTVRWISGAGEPHLSVYSAFNASNLASGYLGDSRTSGTSVFPTRTMSLNVTAGQQYVVVVNDAIANDNATEYELIVSDQIGFTYADTLDIFLPQSGPGYFGETTAQIAGGRLVRNGTASTCGVSKGFPGTQSTGPFRYDVMSFIATQSGCVRVAVSRTSVTGTVHAAAYTAFDNANLSSGYLADSGLSSVGGEVAFEFSVTAGQIYSVVVFEPNANVETTTYRLTVSESALVNRGGITIPTGGTATPYPSTINVAGAQGTVTGVTVSLRGLSHTFPSDLDMLLVAPDGRRMVILSDVGGSTGVTGLNLVLTDAASNALSSVSLSSGIYRPTSVGDDDSFPALGSTPPPVDCQPAGECPHAAPAGVATFASVFGGALPNGAWTLYVRDDTSPNGGVLADGWGLTLTTTGATAPTATTDSYLVSLPGITVAAPGVMANDFIGGGATASVVASPLHGTVSLASDGSFVYTATPGYLGADNFSYQLSNSAGSSPAVTVSLTVFPGAPTANDDAYTTVINTPLSVAAPGVLANDATNGDPISSLTVSSPPLHGTLALRANGSFDYTPTAGFIGADQFSYLVSNTLGLDIATAHITVTGPLTVQAPSAFRADDISGNDVTFRWDPPALGPAPTGYVLEGGVTPGSVLASIPLGNVPLVSFAVPNGAFYVRIRALGAGGPSAFSNEIRIFVNTPAAPSTPDLVGGTVNGTTVELSWRNTFAGGEPTSLALDVSGSLSASLPLAVTDRFSFPSVPAGTYSFSLRALNASGTSVGSSPVTLSFPGACSGAPQVPTRFLAFASPGQTLNLVWDPPASGGAATSYLLDVTGAYVGAVPLADRALSVPVPPGSNTFRLAAVNGCGTSAFTAAQTVVVP